VLTKGSRLDCADLFMSPTLRTKLSEKPSIRERTAAWFKTRPFRLEVGQKGNIDFAVLGECKTTPDSVHGDPDNLRIELREFRQQLIVESQLIAANGTPVCGVEHEHDRFAM
jgi:hypothetical protein